MTHIKAIKILMYRIDLLNKEIAACENIEPEMVSDLLFAEEDVKNFKLEIEQLKASLEILIANSK